MGALGWTGCALILGWAAALSVVDIRVRRLPNALTLGGAVAILAAATLSGHGAPAWLGSVVLAGVYLVVHLAAPTGLGAGDVKLAIGLGALTGALGPEVWGLAALGAPILTAAAGIAGVLGGRRGPVPHGPSMCAASLSIVGLAVF